jgi:hypothetical protein
MGFHAARIMEYVVGDVGAIVKSSDIAFELLLLGRLRI